VLYFGTANNEKVPVNLMQLPEDFIAFNFQSVNQVLVAFVAAATPLHCKRSCARENVSVRDMPVSEEM